MKLNSLHLSILLLLLNTSMTAQAAGFVPHGYYPYGHYQPAYLPPGMPYRSAPHLPPYPYAAYERQPYERQPYEKPVFQKPDAAVKPAVKKAASQPLPDVAKNTEKQADTKPGVSGTERKQAFINSLLPYIRAKNTSILKQRKWLAEQFANLQAGRQLSQTDRQKIIALAEQYRVKPDDLADAEFQQNLLKRVDIIPASLTLAQAANESGWGRSRFAREANNLFGIWTYDADKGLKPKNRDADKKHYVRKFSDIGESVRYYMHMLNSHPAYAELRNIREQLRRQNNIIEGRLLAQGLEKYSAKGNQYIELIQQLIAQNQWALLDKANYQA